MLKQVRIRGAIKFEKGSYPHKYKATVTLPNGKTKTVQFGHQNYEQYHDKIGLYRHLDHHDAERRQRYRTRHQAIRLKTGQRAIDVKYSPAWFSYRYLW